MKEFIDKLIGRLEYLQKDKYVLAPTVCYVLEGVKQYVNQLAEEYNDGWIACSERLPEDIVKDCLVTLENGAVFQASYSSIGQEFRMICWHGIERFSEDNKVIAW